MNKIYYVGKCPICREYGKLEIDKNIDSNEYLVICDECLAEWKNPEDALKNIHGHRGDIENGEVRSATLDEIKNIGWESFIVN